MKPIIKTQELNQEFYTDEGCYITELSNSNEDPGLSIARARVKAGNTTRWHYLSETAERYVILEGKGRMELAQQPPQTVVPGDVVLIPPGCHQRITNTGNQDLVFLALCTPAFNIDNYVEVDH